MEKTVFSEKAPGLAIDEVIRDYDFSMPVRHFHDTCEIYYLKSGSRYYFIDSISFPVKEGDLVLIDREQIHRTSTLTAPYHDRILLQISPDIVKPLEGSFGMPSLSAVFRDAGSVIHLSLSEREEALRLFEVIRNELQQKLPGGIAASKLAVADLLILILRTRKNRLSRDSSSVRESLLSPRHKKVNEIAEYLQQNCTVNEPVSTVASRFYLSTPWLNRIFREVTSLSVNEYRTVMRLKKAQSLLTHTALSVTEISEECGFNTVTYFEKIYRRYFSETPLAYRRQLKQADKNL